MCVEFYTLSMENVWSTLRKTTYNQTNGKTNIIVETCRCEYNTYSPKLMLHIHIIKWTYAIACEVQPSCAIPLVYCKVVWLLPEKQIKSVVLPAYTISSMFVGWPLQLLPKTWENKRQNKQRKREKTNDWNTNRKIKNYPTNETQRGKKTTISIQIK